MQIHFIQTARRGHRRVGAIRLALLLLLAVTAFGCRRDEIDFPLPEGDKIEFKTQTFDDFATRSAGYTTNGPHSILSMGICAGYSTHPWVETDPINFMSNQKVERAHAEAPWLYSPELYWPGNGVVSFFAYAPHNGNAVWDGIPSPLITDLDGGVPGITHTVASSHDRQVDLLVATPVKNQTKRDYITLPLRHALTKIAFSARVANEPAAGFAYRVTKVRLANLYDKGSCPMDGDNRRWTPLGGLDGQYTQSVDNGGLKPSLDLTPIYQSITPTTGHLFLLPQILDRSALVEVTYVASVNGVEEEKTKTLELPLAIAQWRPGEAYNLMFTVDNGISMVVAPTPWDNTTVAADIKNRILNVTRIEANVYSGVATRIWFWSNQPKDSVYVCADGNLDSPPSYPNGSVYSVNDLFQSLSGASAVNLHYQGFDGVTTVSGEGYIDVLHQVEPTTPFAPLLPDGDKRHIWLNASGLARNIRLNSIVRSNPTETPYIGTFHRWNETGERIVSWAYNDEWSAQVVEGQGEILIDRQPSPYMVGGQLYGDGDVGDPEVARLHPDSTGMIRGQGWVYFRVGWKSHLVSRGTSPRYGVIKVSGPRIATINGISVDEFMLYIRQGELEDYVMGPDDGGAGFRPYAVKWSPYNLTASTLDDAKPWVQINAARSNALFVRYPTQAGAHFQWRSEVNPRYAYHPATPGVFDNWDITTLAEKVWSEVMSVNESCPPGYRRPTDGSIIAKEPVWNDISTSEIRQSLFAATKSGNSDASNSGWGYYADGFFDRRMIKPSEGNSGTVASAVLPATANVGYIGRLFYRTTAPSRSLFFPAASVRTAAGGELYDTGRDAAYLSSTREGNDNNGNILFLFAQSSSAQSSVNAPLAAYSVRCVRDFGFNTGLNPDTEVVVPTALSYTAHSNALDAAYVEEWVRVVAQAVSLLSSGSNLRAKVTFTGTVTSGTVVVSTSDLLGAAQIAKGSTVTFDFSKINWTSGAVVEMAVQSSDWEFQANNDPFQEGNTTHAAVLRAPGIIVLRKK